MDAVIDRHWYDIIEDREQHKVDNRREAAEHQIVEDTLQESRVATAHILYYIEHTVEKLPAGRMVAGRMHVRNGSPADAIRRRAHHRHRLGRPTRPPCRRHLDLVVLYHIVCHE